MLKKFLTLLLLLAGTAGVFAQKTGPEPGTDAGPSRNVYRKSARQLPAGANAETIALSISMDFPMLEQTHSELTPLHAIESPGGLHFTFAQSYEGKPVYGGSLKVNANKQWRVMSYMDNLMPFQPVVRGAFVRSPEDAGALILSDYQRGQQDFTYQVESQYLITEGELLPVYVCVTVGENESWEVVLDANNLQTLQVRDRIVYHRRFSEGDPPAGKTGVQADGTGMVFNPDPLTTAGVQYGGNYVDGNDADSPFLNDERVSVVLRDLTVNAGTYMLSGPYVNIEDLEAPTAVPVTSLDGTFNYTRSESGFEDVMCYYHIDTFQRYIQGLGFTNLQNGPLDVDPHGLNGSDNSHFVPNGGASRLGFGEGGVDDAEDADVIIHEYGHALSYSASPNSNSGTERQGLDEGVGDYLAASYSKSLNTFRWDDVFTWDGHNSFWGGRSASTSQSYPYTGWDFYVFGEIWASTCMQVHDVEGREVSDKNFLQELYSNANNMTLNDAGHLIIDADTMLYGGSHTQTYLTYLCQRGIFTGAECFVGVDDETEDLRWQVWPNPALNGEVNLSTLGMPANAAYSYVVTDLLGREVLRADADYGVQRLSTAEWGKGVYLFTLLQDGRVAGTEKIVVR